MPATIVSDFSWIPSPFPNVISTANTTLSDGTAVTISTSPTALSRDQTAANIGDSGSSGIITSLNFSRTISTLRLSVGDLDTFESLSNFSVSPSSVDGVYQLNSGVVTSTANNNGGNLFWNGLNSTLISFTLNRPPLSGILLGDFEINEIDQPPVTSVPETSSILGLLSLGVLGIGAALKRKL
ncbi:MAG UNVERIFIED_CONTAM: hypothetical protein LVR29_31755 [Microcystis novacekii LVE1205-3]|jgi:hypothetical protein